MPYCPTFQTKIVVAVLQRTCQRCVAVASASVWSMAFSHPSLSQQGYGMLPCVRKQSLVFWRYTQKFNNISELRGGWQRPWFPLTLFRHSRVSGYKLSADMQPNGRILASALDSTNNELPPQKRSAVSWLEHWSPEAVKPYAKLARLDKPDAIWLYAWPCFWSITVAAKSVGLPDMKMLALFGYGSVILRGAACTINDLLDRDIDKKVERTKSRPLASGAITPARGFYFLVVQVLLWLGFILQLNKSSLIPGACWLLLFFSYPLMKRITYWPQAYLGFAMNWGAILGWIAIKGSLDYAIILPMYAGAICWTLVYDTIYAHQDRKDDLKAGVKSTAIKFGHNTKYWLSAFGAACIGSLALSGYNAGLAWPYYTFLAAAAGQLGWQISAVDLSNGSDCNRKFVSNKWFGAYIFGGILFGQLASR